MRTYLDGGAIEYSAWTSACVSLSPVSPVSFRCPSARHRTPKKLALMQVLRLFSIETPVSPVYLLKFLRKGKDIRKVVIREKGGKQHRRRRSFLETRMDTGFFLRCRLLDTGTNTGDTGVF